VGIPWIRIHNPPPVRPVPAFAGLRSRNACSYRELIRRVTVGPAKMDQWLSNLSPFEIYLIAAPAIMLGAILFLGGIIALLEPRNKNDAEKLRRALEKAGAKLNDGKR
jgi:hypothetical protein